jgi:hypothetical protein
MIFKLLPFAYEALLVYRGSLITNPVGNAEPTDWDPILFLHNHFQEVDRFIEVSVATNGLSR